MKNLFKIVAFSIVMTFAMGTMSAQSLKQDQSNPEVVAKKRTEYLSEKLSLNGDQQRSVFRALVVKENNYTKDVYGKDTKTTSVQSNKKKHDEVFEISMKKALNDDQFKMWQTLRDQ